jgi:HSP20 family protein
MSQVLPERSSRTPDRFQPAGTLDPLDRMRSLLDQTLGGEIASLLEDVRRWTPPVDIEETDDAYVIEAEVPGVKREDVDIELEGNELTVSGEVKQREGKFRRRTRRVGQFELRVVLPDGVDSDRVEANLDNGVLTVRVPKSERAQRRRIDLRSDSRSDGNTAANR